MKRTLLHTGLAAALLLSGCSLWQDMENALLTVPPLGKSTVASFLGTTEGFEAASEGLHYRLYQLFTKNYIRVELPAKDADPALDNLIVKVKLGELTPDKQALKCILLPLI